MNSTVFNRLVDSYEQQISSLFSRGVSLRIQMAAYQEALIRVARSLSAEAAVIFPHPGLLPLQKTKPRGGHEIEIKYPEVSPPVKRRRPLEVKAPPQLVAANRQAGKGADQLKRTVKLSARSKNPNQVVRRGREGEPLRQAAYSCPAARDAQ